MAASKEFRLYLGQCFWTGISIAYMTGLIIPILVAAQPGQDQNVQLQNCLTAYSLLGVGEMLGGLAMGLVVDKLSSKSGVVMNVLSIIISCAVALIQINSGSFTWLSYMFTFCWGF